jgi:hypothetical protein
MSDIKDKAMQKKSEGVRRNASLNKMIKNIQQDNPEFKENPDLIFLPTLKEIIKVEYVDKDGKSVKTRKSRKKS